MSLTCLDNIIGISRSECSCITEKFSANANYNKSTSGLFLDEVPGIVSISGVAASLQCCDDVAEWYAQAIETAKTTLRDELIVGYARRYKQASKSYNGRAGGYSFSSNQSISGSWAGIWLQNKQMRGGKMKIKSIYTMFENGPTTLKLYRMAFSSGYSYSNVGNGGALPMEFVRDITVTSTPNALTNNVLSTAIELDMDYYSYFILYDTTGIIPKNNIVSCGCGSSEIYLRNFINLIGVWGSDLNNIYTWNQSLNGNGLAFEVEVGCNADNITCSLFEADIAYQTVISHAILNKAAELVMEKVMNSGKVNRYTLQSNEYMWGKRNHFKKEFDMRATWLVETVNINGVSDCYTCQDENSKIVKGNILV